MPVPLSWAMTSHNQVLGFRGERIAERWLQRKGWRVLQRRFRDGHRDLDLIAERQGTVAFVEVKGRPSRLEAEAALTPRQAGTDGFFGAVLERRA